MQLNWQCQRSIAELYPVAVKRWGLANHRELSHSQRSDHVAQRGDQRVRASCQQWITLIRLFGKGNRSGAGAAGGLHVG
ncbi:MAG: hypothetical protein QOI10_3886, partial [Solirubrobacterales bacterium]|nr:hypothetical protein [Solirubrobacterales bacterium]